MTSLVRYGLEWKDAQTPVAVPMEDGYWTPAHEAEDRIESLEEECARLKTALDTAQNSVRILEGQVRGTPPAVNATTQTITTTTHGDWEVFGWGDLYENLKIEQEMMDELKPFDYTRRSDR